MVAKPITTYALALDFETNISISREFPENKILVINNLESFYNYRTVGANFKLYSSILSNENNLIEIKVKNKNSTSNLIGEIIPEVVLSDNPVNFLNLHLKKHRIKSAMAKIKALQSSEANFQNEINLVNNENPPQFCRKFPGSAKKPACIQCTSICSFSIESILHPTKSVSQTDIIAELELHHHPKSRKIKNNQIERQRLTCEAARELADHYIYVHKMKEPIFL